MRLTLKSVLSIVGVVVIVGSTLLLSQCKSPVNHGETQSKTEKQYQNHRQPLMTAKQAPSGIGETLEGYDESLYKPKMQDTVIRDKFNEDSVEAMELAEITCNINDETSIPCKRDKTEVYIPFTFIHNYFEVYGEIVDDGPNGPYFQWSHSNSRLFESEQPYNAFSSFLNFEFFNVEARERVKCISASEGVPISTQWSPAGYTYPTQIAQFGLSHFSKYINQGDIPRIILEDGSETKGDWSTNNPSSHFKRIPDQTMDDMVFQFETAGSDDAISLDISELDTSNSLVMSMYLRMSCDTNSSISVTLETRDKRPQLYQLHYLCLNTLVTIQDHYIYYGLDDKTGWIRFTRNLLVDFWKGVASGVSKRLRKQLLKSKINLLSIELRGNGMISNLKLSKAEHLNHVYDAADWLVNHQDAEGGWAVSVARKMVPGVMEAPPGWYSSMAQGQAISLFVRAAHLSGNQRYLEAAVKATQLYTVNSTKGGVRTYFPGGYVWYEEYPTTPSSFVLNGFIYSLFGLYDLTQAKNAPTNKAKSLFDNGMKTLNTLLPLYDSGSGSFYDLRHFTTHLPPKIARWDYHTTHITQLLSLASFTKYENMLTIAERWKGYTIGRRASHN